MKAIWLTETGLLKIVWQTIIERLIRQLEGPIAIGVPEHLVDQLPLLNCTKFVVSSEQELHDKIGAYFPNEEIQAVLCTQVATKSGPVNIITEKDLEMAREWVKAEGPKVCYVGQRLYFGKQVPKDALWLELANGTDCDWNQILRTDADLFVFFMPQHIPPGIKNKIRNRIIGVHAEPLPKHVNGKYVVSDDIHKRLIDLTAAFDLYVGHPDKWLYHHDKTSFPTLEREGIRVREFISAVDTDTYFPEDREKKWDIIFYGRETQHRLNTMMPAKHVFGGRFLHIAHGIDGDELNRLQNMSTIAVNCHTEGIPALENRLQVAMASKLLVLSEPLSHNDFFVPGKHFIEFRSTEELILLAQHFLEHEDEREVIARAGYELVTQKLAAKVAWPNLISEVMESV